MKFYTLNLSAVIPETAHAVRLRFAVPADLRELFTFKAGQFLTLRATVNGADIRRSYSICSTPAQLLAHGTIEVGIKRVQGGAFSSWAQTLVAGDTLQVLPPDGRFTLPADAEHTLLVAAGSGITPLLSILGDTLAHKENSRFTVLYGNKNSQNTLFLESLQALKNRYPTRLDLHLVMSRQLSDIALHNGRIDAAKLMAVMNQSSGPLAGQRYQYAMVCGPDDMIDVCEGVLPGSAVGKVLSERFGTPLRASSAGVMLGGDGTPEFEPLAELTIVSSGLSHRVEWTSATPLLLDAGLAAGLDLPYACKGGVCCTCRAKLIDGTVAMDKNYTLEADEVAAGFVLTCQCRPTSARVVVSYDER